MCVQKVAGASPDRWRQCVKEDPPGRWDSVSFFVSTSYHKTTFHNVSLADIVSGVCSRASSNAEWCTVSVSSVQDTICQDTFHNTQSVQDTICSRHISQDTICSRHDLLSEIHPMSTSPAPVIEYVASVSAITYTALSPVTEYVAPALVVTYAAASWDIDYVSHSN